MDDSEQKSEWFPKDVDDSNPVWRYIGFTQYVSLLSREALRFTNSIEFRDPYEGALPPKNKEKVKEEIVEQTGHRESYASREVDALNEFARQYLVNCWTKKEQQSAALWDLYTSDNKGIAIKSTAGDLKDSLNSNDFTFYYGAVEYINYAQKEIPDDNKARVYFKRKSFDHEEEYRIVVREGVTPGFGGPKSGTYVNCDIDTLVDHVYVHPSRKTEDGE